MSWKSAFVEVAGCARTVSLCFTLVLAAAMTAGAKAGCPPCDSSGCSGDLTASGSVGVPDLLELLSAWGPCADGCPGCDGDVTCSGSVDVPDLLDMLGQWGDCPPPVDSCIGFCGGQSPFGCWCDEPCCEFADCCFDQESACALCASDCVGGCVGHCGSMTPDGGWCDEACCEFLDCAPNKCCACGCDHGNCGPGGQCLPDDECEKKDDCVGGCVGHCGGQTPEGGWCDEACCEFLDCAPNKCCACGCDHGNCGLGGQCLPDDECEKKDDCVGGCVGHCGGQTPEGGWCDEACCQFLDCAANKCCACRCDHGNCGLEGQCVSSDKCPAGCQGYCGGQSPDGCWCDEQCWHFADCCDDWCDHCLDLCPDCCVPVTGCVDSCGGQAPDGCWCDQDCFFLMDCCDDVCEHCNFPQCEPGPPPPAGCDGSCGGQSPDGCWCDVSCHDLHDCCDDVCDHCDHDFCDDNGDPGPEGCNGYCGGQSPEGCWCDRACCHLLDCCADEPEFCGQCPGSGGCFGYCGALYPGGCWCDET